MKVLHDLVWAVRMTLFFVLNMLVFGLLSWWSRKAVYFALSKYGTALNAVEDPENMSWWRVFNMAVRSRLIVAATTFPLLEIQLCDWLLTHVLPEREADAAVEQERFARAQMEQQRVGYLQLRHTQLRYKWPWWSDRRWARFQLAWMTDNEQHLRAVDPNYEANLWSVQKQVERCEMDV